MKTRFIHFLIGIVFAVMAHAAEPSAESLKKCPNGHETLKDVRIAYGLPPFTGPEAEKWRKAIKDLELVPGGCARTDDSPTRQTICTTCRFTHSILSLRHPDDASWTRTSPDVQSFSKPISDLAKSFPIPAKELQKNPVAYTESLNDALEIKYESVGYTSKAPLRKIKAEVNKWFKKSGFKCTFSSGVHKSDLNGAVRDILEWKTADHLSVSITLQYEHSDKTSWVDATFYK